MTGLLQACDTIEEATGILECYGDKLLPGLSGQIYTMAASRNQLRTVGGWGTEPRAAGMLHPTDCWALRRGVSHTSDAHGVCCAHVGDGLCVPLTANGDTLGLMVIKGNHEDSVHRIKLLADAFSGNGTRITANLDF
jgi:hypothetical protein